MRVRCEQSAGTRGSLKWIQRAVNVRPAALDSLILPSIPDASRITWLSPLEGDAFAEYRDYSFLTLIGHPELGVALADFRPEQGPQWDALGRTDSGEIILVEAKAHIDEMFSSGTQASGQSLERIKRSLDQTVVALGANPLVDWSGPFYQMANRLAHLHFMSEQGVAARLVFVCFVGDADMDGPKSEHEWRGALRIVGRMLGLPKRHAEARRVVEVFPDTTQLPPLSGRLEEKARFR